MAISVTIDSVETEDGAPASPPYKISDKPGKSKLTFSFSVLADDVIRAWRARFNPTDRNHGQLIAKRGMVCGSGDVCGPDAFSLFAESPLAASEELDEPAVHANPDGDYPVEVFAMIEGEWDS